MIFITGDTHGLIDINKLYAFSKAHPELTKSDYMIIAGDFGGVWSKKSLESDLDFYGRLPFTVLFVDGNHENFDLLESYPIEQWKGGKVHKIRPDIIHLMRGQVFEIEGKTFFAFGGATSIDKAFRREGESWWSRELPTYGELEEGITNLKKYGNKIDFIITHSCDERALWYPPLLTRTNKKDVYTENQLLTYFEENITYGHWYFGHYHIDGQLNPEKTALYENIVRLI